MKCKIESIKSPEQQRKEGEESDFWKAELNNGWHMNAITIYADGLNEVVDVAVTVRDAIRAKEKK